MESLRKILPFLKKYRWQMIIAIAAMMVLSITDLLVPRQMQTIIDQGIANLDNQVVIRSSLLMIGLTIISLILAFVNTIFSVTVSESFAADLRNKAFSQIQKFSFSNLDNLQTSELLVRLTSDINIVKRSIQMTMRILIRAPLMLIGSLFMSITTSPRLAMLILVLIPAILVLVWVFSSKARPLFKAVQQRLEKVNTVLHENIAGVRLVRSFVRGDHEKKRFAGVNEDLTQTRIKVNRLLSFLIPTLMLILNLGIVALFWFGGNMNIAGTITTGQIVAFSNYLLMTMFPIMLLGMILPQYYASIVSMERILEVIETEPTIVFPETSAEKITEGRVVYEDVGLDYDGDENEHQPVLRNVSFTAEPGQTVAILGATGSGKTSLVNLIPRLYDPTEGRVLIDGVDVREFSQAELRRNVTMALQNAVLFSGTVADSIRFGRPEASDEDVIAAAKAAQAHDFIMEKEDGYQSHVEQRGANFSGGQKQRLAIARALCVNPRILILDDSTSAVDVETEAEIQKALKKLMVNRTNFIVAQRISTVLAADKIIVLENGHISAEGTHETLIESSPTYQAIYHSQLGDGVEKAGELAIMEVQNA
ncbi:MAG: ABC transporter ATP-binding protein [Chloroflexota bacterium]|nr:ABC transporter ATP-binding protein [Chloroflexota bacterium]